MIRKDDTASVANGVIGMSVAQVLGTLSFAAFLLVVVRDLRRAQMNETNGAKTRT